MLAIRKITPTSFLEANCARPTISRSLRDGSKFSGRGVSRYAASIIAVLFVGFAPVQGFSETVSVSGPNGANGANGLPGENGEAGEAGADAVASTTTPADVNNTAVATGGNGGRGGSGGFPGGLPAAGGAGGAADAQANTSPTAGSATAIARATGGRGGDSGFAGLGVGGVGGAGGAANAIATGSVATGGSIVSVEATAQGGGGGAAQGLGQPGSDGGAAVATAEGTGDIAGVVTVDVHALATGGNGSATFSGSNTGGGGSAEANSTGSNANTGSVTVVAEAVGGNGSPVVTLPGGVVPGDGGTATASAHGASTGGGDVSVTTRATGGRGGVGASGADVVLIDSVSGVTTGRLRLVQEVNGGASQFNANAGAATSSLTAVDADGGALEIESIATVGVGVSVGLAQASASGTGQADVSVLARATGGDGIDGGQAIVHSAFGESLGGGDVSVVAEAIGGAGASRSSAVASGDGANVLVDNAVDGRTSGRLELTQTAIGGDARDASRNSGTGLAGSATSLLDRTVSAGDAQVFIEATGGHGGDLPSLSSGPTTAGGQAIADASVLNDQGSVVARVHAVGGDGGRGREDRASGNGGHAAVRVNAQTLLAGQDVTVGAAGTFGAVGGDSEQGGPTSGLSERGDGGDADSRSVGTALSDSRVSVHDRATGGSGLNGGNALSYAEGHNTGRENVTVLAEAIGGAGNRPNGLGGTALATARGTSTNGDVSVTARVTAGLNGFDPDGVGSTPGIAATLTDAVSGSTAGLLTLIQHAAAGAAASSSGSVESPGGAAESDLSATNDGGGDLIIVSEAVAGHSSSPGGPGGAATASAQGNGLGAASVDVTATASGGAGVSGDSRFQLPAGNGGEASLGLVTATSEAGGTVRARGEVFGGQGGGLGGNGADAIVSDAVSASTSGHLTLQQLAVGGDGTRGGFASSRIDQVFDASTIVVESDARGGGSREDVSENPTAIGGDAQSVLRTENSGGDVEAYSIAQGGDGFDSFRRNGAMASSAGSATNSVRARTLLDGQAIILGDDITFPRVRTGAYGGDGGTVSSGSLLGGAGGEAVSTSDAIAEGDSRVQVFDRAVGGNGGRSAAQTGDGGDASSTATGRNAGSADVVVKADARGGDAGSNSELVQQPSPLANAGVGLARASGFSDSGNVVVSATQEGGDGSDISRGIAGDGAHSESIDAVTGGTTGLLTLLQRATGGDGGTGITAGMGGDARSGLTTENSNGGSLAAVIEATGGDGGRARDVDGVGGGGGDAFAFGETVSSGSEALNLSARAVGGSGGGATEFRDERRDGGDGGRADVGSLVASSSGGGRIELLAEALGGHGGDGTMSGGSGGDGGSAQLIDAARAQTSGDHILVQRAIGGDSGGGEIAGDSGDALSQMGLDVGSNLLDVTSFAMGGQTAAGAGGTGGLATSIVDTKNEGGRSIIRARAEGGSVRAEFTDRTTLTAGGDAVVNVRAESSADGQRIQVGEDYDVGFSNLGMGAFGGSGGPGSLTAGGGGDAISVSEGVALGDSEVEVWDLAVGGLSVGLFRELTINNAGDADSTAMAASVGSEAVTANAMAIGGSVGFVDSEWRKGSAVSSAFADGGGLSNATAFSRIGSASTRTSLSTIGTSIARASAGAIGSSGQVQATAQGESGEIGLTTAFSTVASASASVASAANVIANAGSTSVREALTSSLDAAAYISGGHQRSGEWARVGLSLDSTQAGPDIVLRAAAGLAENRSVRDTLDGVFVSFLEVEIDGTAFSDLVFQIENSGDVVIQRTFSQADEALAFFSSVIDLGDFDDLLATTEIDLEFSIERVGPALGDRFAIVFAVGTVAVPEPGTGLLLSLGLLMMASSKNSGSGRSQT